MEKWIRDKLIRIRMKTVYLDILTRASLGRVADLDPSLGSSKQCSGSVGSISFWASRNRICNYLYGPDPDPDPFINKKKNIKTLISTL